MLPTPPPGEEPSALKNTAEYKAFQRFVQLTMEKRTIQKRAKQIDALLHVLEPMLLGYLAQLGWKSIPVDGFKLIAQRHPWVYLTEGTSHAMVVEALKLSGLENFVRESYSKRTLTTWVDELEQAAGLVAGTDPEALRKILPPAMLRVLDIRPGFKLHMRDERKKGFAIEEEGENEDDHPEE